MSGTSSLTILSEEQKFNGDNLLQWNTNITQLLGSKELLGYINGNIPNLVLNPFHFLPLRHLLYHPSVHLSIQCWIISSMGSSTMRSWLVSTIDSCTVVFVRLLTHLQGASTALAKRESTFVDYILLGPINFNIQVPLPLMNGIFETSSQEVILLLTALMLQAWVW